MRILYKNKKVEKLCTNQKEAKLELGFQVAQKLYAALNAISASKNLNDILMLPQYNLHKLIGDKEGVYSIYLGRNTGYRLEMIPLDENEKPVKSQDMSIYTISVCVKIERISNHYE